MKEQKLDLFSFAEEMRNEYREKITLAGVADAVSEIRTLRIKATNPDREIPARLYVPAGIKKDEVKLPVVLFIHGGGFVSGDFDTHDILTRSIANGTAALVLAIDYRLAPENPFPSGLDDIRASLKWVSLHGSEIGADTSRIAIAGDSAGGNLATVLAMQLRDSGGPELVAQWLMYPCLDYRMDTKSWARLGETNFPTRQINETVYAAYVPFGMSPYDSRISPARGNKQHLPPALIQVGDLDPLCDENIAYAESLVRAGVDAHLSVYKNHHHGFIQFYKDKDVNPDGEKALKEGIMFLLAIFRTVNT